ncbi:hypothetical protein [Ferrovibrio sp.]|uniref:hypothetical protein n=1 Tax=Ferrovibrio sp. TaxID=1917215 RepID=UPI0035AF116D
MAKTHRQAKRKPGNRGMQKLNELARFFDAIRYESFVPMVDAADPSKAMWVFSYQPTNESGLIGLSDARMRSLTLMTKAEAQAVCSRLQAAIRASSSAVAAPQSGG